MMAENKDIPEIRFAGFTDPWEQRKLGDVVGVYDGVHQTPHYTDNGVMFLSVENIATLTSQKFISEDSFERDYKVYPQKGDVLMTRIGDVGTPNVVETTEKLAFYVSLALLKPVGIDSYFLCNVIQSPRFKKGLKDRTLVTAIPQKINKDEIGKVDVLMPESAAEQSRIGAYFRQLDNLITLHQRKYDRLKNVKKSMLEKMFPRDGANVPEIRFAGFTDAWEQRKLSDLAEIVGGGTPDTNNSAYWDGDIDWYAPAEMEGQRYAKGSVRKITELGLQKSSAKILPAHRTVLFTSRAGIGKMAILQRSAATNQGFQSLVLKDGTDPYFIYSMGEKIKDMAEGVASGSTFLEISGKMLGNLEVMVPNLKEQESIATFFRSMATSRLWFRTLKSRNP